MPDVHPAPGVRITVPEGMTVTPMGSSGSALAAAAAAPSQPSPMDESLLAAGFHVVADVRMARTAAAAPGLGAAAAPPTVSVDVQAQESAILLLETGDGVFAWNYPQARRPQPAGLGMAASMPGATLVFSMAPPAAGDALAFGLGDIFSPVLHWVMGEIDGVRARVLKFFVGKAIDLVIDKVEGAAVTGLTSLAPDNPALWKPGGSPIAAPASTPSGGAPQVLLMVHGTFSNTTGSFGALTTTAEGRAFLAEARARYAAVWGFDHKTLAVGPDANASDMIVALQPLLPQGAVVDAVAYSRGGLVYRELAERLLPQVRPDVTLRKAVFVACTNGGTHLAEPKNWKALVDLYTNAAMAATRAITAAAGAPLAGVIAGVTIQLVAQFVQYLSVVAIGDQKVPGLAAMEPDPGAIVRALNGAAVPAAVRTAYHAITSNFVAKLDLAKGITKDLEEMITDGVTNQLFGDDNDLVVDTQFMTMLGSRGALLKPADVFAFGSGDSVCHTTYFAAPQTAQQLSGWLT